MPPLNRPQLLTLSATLILLLAPFPGLAKKEEKSPFRWLEWQQTTLRQAQNLGRPVLLFLTAEWCLECKRVEEEVLHDPQIRERIENSFLPILVDRDRRPDLFARYSRGGLPSVPSRCRPVTPCSSVTATSSCAQAAPI